MTMPFSPCDTTDIAQCTDVTVGILHKIFGDIIGVLVAGTDPNTVAATNLLAAMFTVFNSGILIVGSIIVSYVAAMGAINTANDGEAMGKAWSTVWTPVRIVAGGAVLLPSASGYSFIQMMVLMISLWSVGFANTIYKAGMGMGLLKPDGIVASSYQTGTYFGLRDFAKQYLAASYCARAANAIYTDADGNHPNVTVDTTKRDPKPDKQTVTGTRTDSTFYFKDINTTTNLGGGEPICGSVTLVSYAPAGVYSDSSGTQAAIDNIRALLMSAKLNAALGLMQDIDNWVNTMPSDMNQPGWDSVQSSEFNSMVKARENQIATGIQSQMTSGEGAVNTGVTTLLASITGKGWAEAGGWYQNVGMLRGKLSTITSESVGNVSAPSLSGLTNDAQSELLKNSITAMSESIGKKAELIDHGYDNSTSSNLEDLGSMLPQSGSSDINVSTLGQDMSTRLTLFMNGMMKQSTDMVIGSGSNVDAISRMKMTGDILSSWQSILLAAKVGALTYLTVVRVGVAGVGGVEVFGFKIDEHGVTDALWDWVMTVPMPILSKFISYLGLLGFYFGVALPSLPYTMFMIAVVGWVLGVLQTTLAAPLWAILHMRPSQTFVGSEAQGYLLLMALFVRPALSVIGLFAAMLVADPVVDYIAEAFFAMRGDVASSTGWIGVIAQFNQFFWWFAVFGGLLLPVLLMIFGLPQVLPDRVLAWLNVGVHDLGATNAGEKHSGMLQTSAGIANEETMRKLSRFKGSRKGGGDGSGGGGDGNGGGGGGGGGRGAQPLTANQQGVSPAISDGTQAAAGAGGRNAGRAGARRQFSQRLGEGMGMMIGRAITDTGFAVKDAAAEGKSGFAGRLASNMKDAVVTAGSEGVAAFKQGAQPRLDNFKAAVAARSGLQGSPAESAPATTPAQAPANQPPSPAAGDGGWEESPKR